MYNNPYQLKYVSAAGVTVDFDVLPYLRESAAPFNYKWDYSATDITSGHGAKIDRLFKRAQEKSMTISVYRANGQPIGSDINYLSSIFEKDVLSKTPGRLYVDSQYCTGYIIGSDKQAFQRGLHAKINLTFVTGSPFWITEDLHSFPLFSSGAGIALPQTLPFTLVATLDSRQLYNDHYAASNAIITLFGPCTDPAFTLGTHIYTVSGTLGVGERYEIDQTARTVTKITSSGERINAFSQRGKAYSVFEPIPAGENTLYASGEFAIDILLLQERSEPVWS